METHAKVNFLMEIIQLIISSNRSSEIDFNSSSTLHHCFTHYPDIENHPQGYKWKFSPSCLIIIASHLENSTSLSYWVAFSILNSVQLCFRDHGLHPCFHTHRINNNTGRFYYVTYVENYFINIRKRNKMFLMIN